MALSGAQGQQAKPEGHDSDRIAAKRLPAAWNKKGTE